MMVSERCFREPLMVSTPEAAELLHCDTRTVRGLIRQGKLRAKNVGRTFRVNYSSLKKFAMEDTL